MPSQPFPTQQLFEQLNRILATPAFENSNVLTRFLKYVVTETVEGRGRELKEYNIGTEALSKRTDFDPQLDSIVRIHAGRLRRALHAYYQQNGVSDSILIEIPKGTYVPVFSENRTKNIKHLQTEQQHTVIRNRPVIAVLPFRNINEDKSRDFFADGLGEQLTTELARFQDIAVIAYYSSTQVALKTNNLKEACSLLGARYAVTGSIQSSETELRVSVQLSLCDSGEQLWSKVFKHEYTAAAVFKIQDEIIDNVVHQIGGYYGAITRNMAKVSPGKRVTDMKVYDAMFWFYHHQHSFGDKDLYQKAFESLRYAVQADPEYALAWAVLGELYLDAHSIGIKFIDNQAEEGLVCGLKAAALDPLCQHAYFTIGFGHNLMQNRTESMKAIERGLALNPGATAITGTLGVGLIFHSEIERGIKILEDSIELNPYFPWYFNMGMSVYYFHKQEYEEALYWAERMQMPAALWDPLICTVCYVKLGRMEDARKSAEALKLLLPVHADGKSTRVRDVIHMLFSADELREQLIDSLRSAGLS